LGNCQTLVSLTLGRGEVPVMVALRLFLRVVGKASLGSTIGTAFVFCRD
jgi:hypothetical protein